MVALEKASISGIPFTAYPSPPPAMSRTPRTRGAQGRADAAERNAIKGNGPRGGLPTFGKSVALWGFPGKSNADMVKAFLNGFDLAGGEQGKPDVVKVAL